MTEPQAPDPWKSFRGVMAGTLILEAIVVLLAIPVAAKTDAGFSGWICGFLVAVAVVMVLMTGIQGRSWAIWANIGLQFVLIGGFVLHLGVAFVGLLFLCVWLFIAYLRAEMKRRLRLAQQPRQVPGS